MLADDHDDRDDFTQMVREAQTLIEAWSDRGILLSLSAQILTGLGARMLCEMGFSYREFDELNKKLWTQRGGTP